MSHLKPKIKKPLYKRVLKVALIIVCIFFGLIITIGLLIQTSPVQNFIKNKAASYLTSKFHTNVSLGKIYITFPKNVVVNDIYLEDQKHDTLFSAGKLSVNVSMFKLLHGNIEINTIDLQKSTIKVKRLLPDTVFNFQFIVDAFSSPAKNNVKKKDSSSQISVHDITLDKIDIVYNDVVSGNDDSVFLDHLAVNIDKFDLEHQNFSVPSIVISTLHGRIYQQQPLVNVIAKNTGGSQTVFPALELKNIDLNDIQLDYQNKQSAFSSKLDLNKLAIRVKNFDMQKKMIGLDKIELSKTNIAVELGKIVRSSKDIADNKQLKPTDSSSWKINVKQLKFEQNNIAFDNNNIPRQKTGMDYSHLKLDDLILHVNNIVYSGDTIAAEITKASMKEQSNFELQQLSGNLFYSNKQAFVKNLYFRTTASLLRGNANLNYPSLDAIKKDPSALLLNINLPDSKLQLKDILTFVPDLKNQPIFRDPSMILRFNTKMSGDLANLKIDQLHFSGFTNTNVNIHGSIKGLPETKNVTADLVINNISTTKKDLATLLPANTIPSNIAVPDSLSVKGNIKGGMKDMSSDLAFYSSSGSFTVKGNAKNISDIKNIIYDATISIDKLKVGKILKDENTYGNLTLKLRAKGKGTDIRSAQSQIAATIISAEIKKYDYKNLVINAGLNDQLLKAEISMHDPNIDFSLHGTGDLHNKYPAVQLTAVINNIKTQPLALTTSNIDYKGNIDIDFPVTDPDNLQGKLVIERSIIIKDSQKIAIDTIRLLAGKTDTSQYLRLYADVIQAQLKGKYKLTEMGSVFKQLINPYFTTVATDSVKVTQKYNFTITADITNRPLLRTLLPTLQRLDPIHFAANFNSDKGWNADLVSPMIVYGDQRIKNFQVHVKPQPKLLNIETDLAQFNSGKSIALYGVSFKNSIADNKINFVLNIHDKASKSKYNIAGLFQQPQKGDYKLSLKPDDLLLNYDRWQIDKNNSISFSSGAINATSFNLKKNEEELRINSESKEKNSPLDLEFNKFLLSTLSAIAGSDSLALNGSLNGKIVLSNLQKTPTFVSQLTINDLSFNKDTLGNVSLKVNNNDQNKFTADVRITGKGNDVVLTGDYFTGKGNFDLNLKINKLELASVVGASMGALKKASGSVNGEFALKGTADKPDINGDLKFSNAMLTPSSLANDFYINDQDLKISHGIKFSNFAILDSAKNKLVLNGSVNTEDYKHYNYALTINAKNFRALNSAKTDNQLYYGRLYFNCNLNVKGTEIKPSVDGTIKIDEKTNLTITLPQDEPGIEDRQGIIEFVNKKLPANDSLNNPGKDTTELVLKGIDISTNIIVDSTAILNLIIDPTNGDALTVKGRATLVGGVDQSGKTTLSGTYQLSNGSYDLSFSILKKKFVIQNGSTITWTGEATKANLNINAILIANTAPIDLVDDQLAQTSATVRNTYLQKLPFEVHLHIGGEIMKPQISFDIVLPEDKGYSVSKDVITMVQGKLGMIRLDSGELNKQVFALLLLNRFVGEDPFASGQAGMNAESLARSSVSKILSQQLNQLASSLIKGVDVNFDLQSTDDYTTGQLQNRTDLNVNISKRLLNDRLTVTVGSDYELEGPQNVGASQGSDLVGNLGVDYKLSKDGRYILRAYRKNDYDDIVEGYVVETGMGFIITLDYNKFNEIFGKKKKTKNTNN